MRLYPQIYPGTGILQPGALSGSSVVSAWKKVAVATSFVRRNMRAENTTEPEIDIIAIEQQARAARDAWIGSKLKSYYLALMRKFEGAGESEVENHLAASRSLADLEERERRYLRMRWL